MDGAFFWASIPAVLIAGISKSGFGGGLVVMAVPMMSLVMDPLRAAGIMLPLLLVMDLSALKMYWPFWQRELMKKMFPAAVVGITLGALLIDEMSVRGIKGLNGLIAISLPVHFLWSRYRGRALEKKDDKGGIPWSMLAGFTSFISHSGGPPINMYLLPMRLPKKQFVGTIVFFFFSTNLVKTIPYILFDQMNPENLKFSLVLLPFALIGTRLGIWLHHKVQEDLFYSFCYTFLFITGLKLLTDALVF